jgi:predicted nucleic acid-binding protein
MKRVLYDTHVILDVMLKRDPYFFASAEALDLVAQEKVKGYISGHAITTIASLLQRRLGSSKSRSALTDFLSKMVVAPVTDAAIRRALVSKFNDFEDAVTDAVAYEASTSLIITRNIRDFSKGTIPVILPEIFLANFLK